MDILLLAICLATAAALPYDPEQTLWNLNQNKTATSVLDYWGQWENHSRSLRTILGLKLMLSQHILRPQTTGDSQSTP